MTEDQNQQGQPKRDLYVDIQLPGAPDKQSYKLTDDTAGRSLYIDVIREEIGSTYRFRTPLIHPITEIETGTARTLRVVRPQVGFRDLESNWAFTRPLDDVECTSLFEKALCFLFDRLHAQLDLEVKITIPRLQSSTYTRGTPLGSAIIGAFAALTKAKCKEKHGEIDDYPSLIVVEASEERDIAVSIPSATSNTSIEAATPKAPAEAATSSTPAEAAAVKNSAEAVVAVTTPLAGQAAAQTKSKQSSLTNERPDPPQSTDPLIGRWAQPKVQIIHRVLRKSMCSHVQEAEDASVESNTRFRAHREDCLVCGCFIDPSTENDIRKHYKEHWIEMVNLRARQWDYAANTTPASHLGSGVYQDDHGATTQSQDLRRVLIALKIYTPQQAAGPQQDVGSYKPQIDHGQQQQQQQQPGLAQDSPHTTKPQRDLEIDSANIDPALRQHQTCIFCQSLLPFTAIEVAQHYYTHQDELNRLRLDLERAETEVSALRTNLDRTAGDRAQAERQRDDAEAQVAKSFETAAEMTQERDDAVAQVSTSDAAVAELMQERDEAIARATASDATATQYLEESNETQTLLAELTEVNEALRAKMEAMGAEVSATSSPAAAGSPPTPPPPPPPPRSKRNAIGPKPKQTLLYCPKCLTCLQSMSAQVFLSLSPLSSLFAPSLTLSLYPSFATALQTKSDLT